MRSGNGIFTAAILAGMVMATTPASTQAQAPSAVATASVSRPLPPSDKYVTDALVFLRGMGMRVEVSSASLDGGGSVRAEGMRAYGPENLSSSARRLSVEGLTEDRGSLTATRLSLDEVVFKSTDGKGNNLKAASFTITAPRTTVRGVSSPRLGFDSIQMTDAAVETDGVATAKISEAVLTASDWLPAYEFPRRMRLRIKGELVDGRVAPPFDIDLAIEIAENGTATGLLAASLGGVGGASFEIVLEGVQRSLFTSLRQYEEETRVGPGGNVAPASASPLMVALGRITLQSMALRAAGEPSASGGRASTAVWANAFGYSRAFASAPLSGRIMDAVHGTFADGRPFAIEIKPAKPIPLMGLLGGKEPPLDAAGAAVLR